MIDLKAKPYYLDDEGVRWVAETIASMTLEEKIGQLFVNMGASREEKYLKDVVTRYKFGAVRDPRQTTLKFLVEKLLGKSEFKGVSPVDAFCGFVDTRI